jgi:dihydrofolate synthase/folylpolyglutamate synthase
MTPRERLFALEQFGIKLGLDNITSILAALNRPERSFACAHVAGTNGKGSVTAMVERGLRAAGYRTGRYTSPHLVAIEERVAVGGEPIAPAVFDEVTADVLALIDRLLADGALPQPPTFFEATTAIALETFRREAVTMAVIEVGLGGRFDATNVIAPVVTAITSIAFDHERHLGRTLAQIAFEKAGIIKPHTPVIVGAMAPDAHAVIAEVAHERGAPLVDAVPSETGTPVALALNGAHQRSNAAVAVEILRRCRSVTRDDIITALTDVVWPARLEWLRVPGCGSLLIDAAHNPAGAGALADFVLATGEPMPMVIGVMRDKDVDAIVCALAPAVSRFIATTAPSPRALPAQELAVRIRTTAPAVRCDVQDDPGTAITDACRDGGHAMVAGSIFLVGPVRGELLRRGAVPVRYPSSASPFFLN